jgi:hypothetical protein
MTVSMKMRRQVEAMPVQRDTICPLRVALSFRSSTKRMANCS